MNPLGKIKDVATDTLKLPVAVAGSAVGLAKSATGKATGAVSALVGGGEQQSPTHGDDQAPPVPTDVEPEPEAPEEPPHVDIDPDEPVNVTEELGLDPAPVTKPKPRKKAAPKPVTAIDAQADPSDVDVTPADIADRAGENGPA